MDRSYGTYIAKLLKDVHPDNGITEQAKNSVDSALRTVSSDISGRCRKLIAQSNKQTVMLKDVKDAVSLITPDYVLESAFAYIDEAVEKFEASHSEKSEGPVTRESRAGLVFSVSLAEHYLRNFDREADHTESFSKLSWVAA